MATDMPDDTATLAVALPVAECAAEARPNTAPNTTSRAASSALLLNEPHHFSKNVIFFGDAEDAALKSRLTAFRRSLLSASRH